MIPPDWSPLLHFATIANDETLDPSIRLEAAKAATPFYHPRPKPAERDPEALVDLERKLAEARNTSKGKPDSFLDSLAERLERAKERARTLRDRELQMASDQGLSNPIDGQSER